MRRSIALHASITSVCISVFVTKEWKEERERNDERISSVTNILSLSKNYGCFDLFWTKFISFGQGLYLHFNTFIRKINQFIWITVQKCLLFFSFCLIFRTRYSHKQWAQMMISCLTAFCLILFYKTSYNAYFRQQTVYRISKNYETIFFFDSLMHDFSCFNIIYLLQHTVLMLSVW